MIETNKNSLSKLSNALADLISESIKRSIEEKAIPEQQSEDKNQNDQFTDYKIIRGDEILKMEGDSLPYLVDPLLPKSGIVGFGGSSDTGKSTFLKQLATSISRGESDFLGFPLKTKYGSVIYVSTEDDIHAVKSVLKKQRKKGSRSSTMKGLRFLFNSENIYKQINTELKREPADLVIIDALSDIVSGDLNQSHVVRPFLDKFTNLSKQHECLFIFLHHTSKKSEGTIPKKGNMLGSQSFEAKCRLVSLLVKDPLEDNIRHYCLVKGNYLSDDYKSKSYVLTFNENLTFEYSGERRPLEELQHSEDQHKKKKETENQKKEAVRLRNKGWKLEGIAIELGKDKSTISRWLKEQSNSKKEEVQDNTNEQIEMLEKFIKSNDDFNDLEDLRNKYYAGTKGFKNSIKAKYKKFTNQKENLTVKTFEQLLQGNK